MPTVSSVGVRHGEIELAVAVEVGRHDRHGVGCPPGRSPGGEALRARQRARPTRNPPVELLPVEPLPVDVLPVDVLLVDPLLVDPLLVEPLLVDPLLVPLLLNPLPVEPPLLPPPELEPPSRAEAWQNPSSRQSGRAGSRDPSCRGTAPGGVRHGQRAAGQHASASEADGGRSHHVNTAAVPLPKATAPVAPAIHIQFRAAGSSLAAVA